MKEKKVKWNEAQTTDAVNADFCLYQKENKYI